MPMLDITQYEIGDNVDVYPLKNDIFEEFSGRIVEINMMDDIITVVDQDDEYYDVHAKQIRLTHSEELDVQI